MKPIAAPSTKEIKTLANINYLFGSSMLRTALHRAASGPRLSTWSLAFECLVSGLNSQLAFGGDESVPHIRKAFEQLAVLPLPHNSTIKPVQIGGVPAVWVTPQQVSSDAILLYLHGGGYMSGSPATHRRLVSELAGAMGVRALVPDYRLAPEHPYPAALEDAWVVYWWLLATGYPAERIVVAGESAGGGLTIALLVLLRDTGLPLPAAAVCISPWVDLALTGRTLQTNAPTDYLDLSGIHDAAAMMLGSADPRTPLASPLYADLHGLPPLLIQAGTAEMLFDDAARLAKRAAAAGVQVEFEPWENMVHAWHFMFQIEPEARAAIRSIGRFVRGQLARTAAAAQPASRAAPIHEAAGAENGPMVTCEEPAA